MKGTIFDGKGGWTRVGYLYMSQLGADCPPGLTEHQYKSNKHEMCGWCHWSGASCASTTFSFLVLAIVCGQVRGHRFYSLDVFGPLERGTDSFYVGSISITHGKNLINISGCMLVDCKKIKEMSM